MEVGVLFKITSDTISIDTLHNFLHNDLAKSLASNVLNHNSVEIQTDGLFVIWGEQISKLNDCLTFINRIRPDIQFTLVIERTKLRFLDVEIQYCNDKLETTVYSKKPDSHSYLDYKSCHPKVAEMVFQKGYS